VKKFRSNLFLLLAILSGEIIFAQIGPDSLRKLITTDTNDSLRTVHSIFLGRYYYTIGVTDSALKYGKAALNISVSSKNLGLQASTYALLGVAHYYSGDYKNALANYLLGLKIEEALGRKLRIAKLYNNIGALYVDERFYDLAEIQYNKAFVIYKELKDTTGIIQASNNFGNLYGAWSQVKQDSATAANYLRKALEYNTQTYLYARQRKDSLNISNSLANLGQNYMYLKNYKMALKNLFESLEIEKKLDKTYDIGITLLEIGDVYSRTKNYTGAVNYFNEALQIGEKIQNPEIIKYAYSNLAENFALMGEYEKAFRYHRRFTSLNDSLLNTESTKQIHELQIAFDTEKKEKQNILLQAKNESNDKTIRQQKYFGIAIGLICVLLLVVAIVIFRSNKQKQRINLQLERKNILIERQKELVEEKQKEILDSIHYARRIQRSLLTSEKYIQRKLKDLTGA